MCKIICKKSKKSENLYLVLVVNDVYVTFERPTIEKVAMSVGISNIELAEMHDGDEIKI